MLEVVDLSVAYEEEPVVSHVSFSVGENETVCIVGESGSGKSTILKAIIGLLNTDSELISGQIFFDGMALHSLTGEEFRKIRGQQIAMIYQNAGRSLDPVVKVGKQFYEALCTKGKISRRKSDERAISCMNRLSLKNPEKILKSYPTMLSGGMNQRVAIALAMVMEPRLILADEPTSAQDVTVQVEVVEALKQLKESTKASLLLVSHSMGVVARIADKVGVMYAGHLVEWGTRKQVLEAPVHPYTKMLMSAVLKMNGSAPKPQREGNYPLGNQWTEVEPGHFAVCESEEEEYHE